MRFPTGGDVTGPMVGGEPASAPHTRCGQATCPAGPRSRGSADPV
ncbi:hypothetical protein GJR88_04835 [Dietzia sp. DQ12-45-1b]|nr:hypothetical protein GJR88_04835 [Dietzia sp. DQ12-45-1b]